MTTNAMDVLDSIVRRLRELVQDSPDLKDAAQLYEAILPFLHDADLHAMPVSITRDQACSKMEMGLPLLHDLDLVLDGQAVCDLMIRLASALEKIGGIKETHATAARQIRLSLQGNKLNISDLLPHIAGGERGVAISVAQSLELDADLLWTLAQNTLKPALHGWCRQLTPVAEGIPWHKGYCFICGTGATLGELQENIQVKHLRCGRCGADWLFRRLQCMYCGNEDHNTLGYLYSEDQRDKFRVDVCEKCKGYLKVIAAFAPTPPEMLPVEDLATLHLDYIAQQKGYARAVVR